MKKEDLLSVGKAKKIIKEKSKEELIDLLVECYKNNQFVKEYITAKYGEKENLTSIFEEYKKKIEDVFFPKNIRTQFKISNAKKAISEFKKLCNDEKLNIDLMLYYVEMGVEFTNTFGDINENFYDSIASMFDSVVYQINNQEDIKIYNEFEDRIKVVVHNTGGIGWGFHEAICDIYFQLIWLEEE